MFLFCFGKERFFLLLQVWEFMRRDLFLIFSFWATNCFLYFLEPSNLKPQWPKIYWAPRSKSTEAKIIGTSATLAYPQRKTSDHTDKPFVPSGSVISHTPPTHTHKSLSGFKWPPHMEITSLSSESMLPIGSLLKHHLKFLEDDKMNSSGMALYQAFTLTSTKRKKETV